MRRLIHASQTALAPQVRAWRGEAALWEVFWVQGVCVSLTLACAFAAAFLGGDLVSAKVLLLVLTGYTGWVLVAIWRCAEGPDAGRWGPMAQALSIPWAINTLLLAGALALTLR